MFNSVTTNYILNALIFSLLGIIVLAFALFVIDRLTPGNFRKEIFEEHNTALAIIIAGIVLGLSYIIGSAIHG